MWTHPALTDERWARLVRSACELYREAGHRLLLVAQTLDTDADVAELLDAMGADEVFLVRLEAKPASLVGRFIERRAPSWSGLRGLVAHPRELAETLPGLTDVDLSSAPRANVPRTSQRASAPPGRTGLSATLPTGGRSRVEPPRVVRVSISRRGGR